MSRHIFIFAGMLCYVPIFEDLKMICSYMEKTFCIDCKKTTNHNNGECLSCVNKCKQEQDTLMRIDFGAKTVNQKLDYLFETLVLGNKRT